MNSRLFRLFYWKTNVVTWSSRACTLLPPSNVSNSTLFSRWLRRKASNQSHGERRKMNRWSRKLHRWSGILVALPLLLVIVTGLMLQLKKEIAWIQPVSKRGIEQKILVDWDQILSAVKTVPESQVNSWDDIDRLDVRPAKGLVKVRCINHWEVQLDSSNGEILSSAFRRSDIIESLHDGSFFSDFVKLYVFSANGFLLLGLWITGVWLWYLPISAKRKKKRRLANKTNQEPGN